MHENAYQFGGLGEKNAPNENKSPQLNLNQSEHAFRVIHRRRMFILVILLQKILAAIL